MTDGRRCKDFKTNGKALAQSLALKSKKGAGIEPVAL
jgi:hypothetical protein